MARPPQQNAVELAAEGIGVLAKEAGVRVGLAKGTATVTILEKALAQAWADVALWHGANDTPERLNEAAREMARRIAEEMRLQHYLRRGHKPS